MNLDPTEIFTHDLQTTAELLMREHNTVVFVWDRNLNSTDCWRVLTDSENTDAELDERIEKEENDELA